MPAQRKANKDNEILSIIKPMFEKHKSRYGYRRIILNLYNDLEGVNHKRIQRFMRENGLFGKQDTHVITFKRDFSITGPNQKWTIDVSMFKISEGKLYLSPTMDMYDSSIISYDISTSPNFTQTKRMIDDAFKQYNIKVSFSFRSRMSISTRTI